MRLESSDDRPSYDVQGSEPAEIDRDTIYLSRMGYGLRSADRWLDELLNAVANLADMPRMWPRVPGRNAANEIRQMLVGRRRDIYRVFYSIHRTDGDDRGVVRIIHIRHTSRGNEEQDDKAP